MHPRQLPPRLRVASALASALLGALAAVALGADAPADVPPDVAARWSRLDPKKWNMTQLQTALPLLRAPPGFRVDLYYRGGLIDNARSLAMSGNSTHPGGPIIVYVSSKKANRTYALVDRDADGVADEMTVLVDYLDTPQGMDWKDGDLYVSGWKAGQGMIWRLRDVDSYALKGKPYPIDKLEVVSRSLPADRWHGERYMRFSPADGLLYVTIGAPCNYCQEKRSPQDVTFSSIYTLDTKAPPGNALALRLFATGLRNVVGLDWHPDKPGEMYFTVNGRDKMGDDVPDCTLDRAERPGIFFGFPYCHAEGAGDPYLRSPGPGTPIPDPNINVNSTNLSCSDPESYRRPVQALGPHTAPLGLRFYRWELGRSWPREYDRALIIAEHGSWDRSSKVGYRLALVKLSPDQTGPTTGQPPASPPPLVTDHSELLTGFVAGRKGAPKDNQTAWGRPADVMQLPDGSLLISDDAAHTVYRMRYDPAAAAAASQQTSAAAPRPGGGGGSAAAARQGGATAALVAQLLVLLLLQLATQLVF